MTKVRYYEKSVDPQKKSCVKYVIDQNNFSRLCR